MFNVGALIFFILNGRVAFQSKEDYIIGKLTFRKQDNELDYWLRQTYSKCLLIQADERPTLKEV